MRTGKPPPGRRSAGFTYLAVIILVAIIGLVGAAGLKMGALMQRRAAEQALLAIGGQFADALKSYAAATPRGQPSQPPSIRELLKDPRFPGVRRHLRQLFVDPITGKAEWGVTYLAGDVGVLGIHSLSGAQPLKVANFEPWLQDFEGKSAYREWEFGAAQARTDAPATPPADGSLISPMELLQAPDAASPGDATAPSGNLISPLHLR